MTNSTTPLWLVALCFGLFAFRSSVWVPVNLDNRVSVRLPSQPQETVVPAPAKMLSVKDAAGTYIIIMSPLGADFQGNDRKQYYDSVVEGALNSGRGKLEGRSTFKVGGYDGIEFTASIVRPDNQQTMLVFVRCLIVDKKSYVLQFLPANGKDGATQHRTFFDSLTLQKPKLRTSIRLGRGCARR